jgi:hypothetical protein
LLSFGLFVSSTRFVTFKRITLASLKKRSGLHFRDGSHIRHLLYDCTIQQQAKRLEGVFHKAQVVRSVRYFASRGYSIFPGHIAVEGVNRWADFAVARYRRVVLVECMTDWFFRRTIDRKAALAGACELWFVAESNGMKRLRQLGYKCKVMPFSNSDSGDMKAKFWLCRPEGARDL